MIVVTGAQGQLGTAFRSLLPSAVFLNRSDLDLRHVNQIEPTLKRIAPDAVINCAAFTAVDEAENDEAAAFAVNSAAVGAMAGWCAKHGARFITYSTDYVFDGRALTPYVESDPVGPLNAYGRSKAAGERLALSSNPDSLIIRTSWVISGTHRNFVTTILKRAADGVVAVVDDQRGCPTIVDDLAVGTMQALARKVSGVLHLTNREATTWFGLARKAVELAGIDPARVQPTSSDLFSHPAKRPAWSVLGSERLDRLGMEPLPRWEQSLSGLVQQGISWIAKTPEQPT